MDDQTVTFENRRAIGISPRGKVSPVLLSSLTFIDTDINGLRRYVLLTAFPSERRQRSNKNAVNPNGIHAFPRTFKDLQVAHRYLRLKRADEAAGTKGHEYHCEGRDAYAHCHGNVIVPGIAPRCRTCWARSLETAAADMRRIRQRKHQTSEHRFENSERRIPPGRGKANVIPGQF
jgi:hypothetical protein